MVRGCEREGARRASATGGRVACIAGLSLAAALSLSTVVAPTWAHAGDASTSGEAPAASSSDAHAETPGSAEWPGESAEDPSESDGAPALDAEGASQAAVAPGGDDNPADESLSGLEPGTAQADAAQVGGEIPADEALTTPDPDAPLTGVPQDEGGAPTDGASSPSDSALQAGATQPGEIGSAGDVPATADPDASPSDAAQDEASASADKASASSNEPALAPAPSPDGPSQDPSTGLSQSSPEQPAPVAGNAVPTQAGWVTKGGQRYYLDADGRALTGEQKIGDSWYFLDPDAGGAMRTGFRLDSSGRVVCYDVETGKKLFGEQTVHGSVHDFDAKTGEMRTGLVELPKTSSHAKQTSCFDEYDGSMRTGAVSVAGKSYYFSPSTGAMVHDGWGNLGTGEYSYYGHDGTVTKGEAWIEGERYWFDPTTGASSYRQFLRWNLNHAPQTDTVGCFNGAGLSSAQLSGVTSVVDLIRSQGYSVGFVLMDIKTGKGVACNPNGVFYSASTVKAPYIASVYEKAFHNSTEASAPWYDVLEDVCVWSDNYEYAYLRETFGNGIFADWLGEVCVDASKASHNYAWYSARDLGKMWLGMYDYFSGGSPAAGQLASLLSHGFGSSIYDELGSQYPVSSKGGWYPTLPGYTATNDAGIVHAPSGDYLLAIMTDAPERFDLTRALVRALDGVYGLF